MTARRFISVLRLLLAAVFAVLAVAVLAIGLAARLAPITDHELYAIRSGSMEPAFGVGSVVVVDTSGGGRVDSGQAIAFRLSNGTVVTHRVVELVQTDDGSFVRTRGDANPTPDPSLVPMSAVIGPVSISLPLLGFLLAMLGMPIGVVTLLSVAASLITAIWLLEEFERLEPEANPGAHPQGGRHDGPALPRTSGRGGPQ